MKLSLSKFINKTIKVLKDEINITENGIYDVSDYAKANVSISSQETPIVFPSNISFGNSDFTSTNTKWIENADASNVISLQNAFGYTTNLEKLDLSKWNTNKVTNVSYMFTRSSLKEINISGWNAEKITNASYMCGNSSSLNTLKMNGWSVSGITTMSNMFSGCTNLSILEMNDLDTSHVTNMENCFFSCSNLTSLDLSSFDTSSVSSFYQMFVYCSSLTHINFGTKFNMGKCTNLNSVRGMFTGITKLDDETWNSLLNVLLTATSLPSDAKRLTLMMSTAMAEKCSTLSNWSALEAAGWVKS